MRFCLYQREWGANFTIQKNDFKNLKKLRSIANIFIFFKNFMPKQRMSLFLSNPSL